MNLHPPAGVVWMMAIGIREDLRYAGRSLLRNPGFTVVAAATLAIGIGANTAIFSAVNAVLLRPLPFKEPNRLAFISIDPNDAVAGIYQSNYAALTGAPGVFDGVAWYYRNSGWSRVTLTGSDPETVQGAFVSASLFPLMGVSAAIGRTLVETDEAQRQHVVVLSDRLWRRRFGASRDIVGRTLPVDGVTAEIVGVMPAAFQFPAPDAQFWAPITTNRFFDDPSARVRNQSNNRFFYTRWHAVARLKAGVTLQGAQSVLDAIAARLPEADPLITATIGSGTNPDATFGLSLIPLRIEVAPHARLTLLLLLGAVSSVLLIACANIASLILARGTTRHRELAIRAALGAGRGRLVRELFTESALLALLAAVVGLLAAAFGTQALVKLGPPDIPRLDEARVDLTVLAYTGAVTMLAAALFGLAPAWTISRSNPNDALKSGTAGSGQAARTSRMRRLLVVVEVAVAVVLLAAAGLLVRSFLAVRDVDPGFQPERVLTMRITMPAGTSDQQARALTDTVQQRVRALPGASAAGAINGLFGLGPVGNFGLRSVEGHELTEGPGNWSAPLSWSTVSGEYLQAMGAPLLRGRFFSPDDVSGAPLVAIVDESMARRYWARDDPIGRRFKGQDHRGNNDEWITVVGVVGAMRRHGVEREPLPQIYLPQRQERDRTPDLVVRTAGDPRAIAGAVRGVVRSLDASAILSPVTTLEQQIDLHLAPRRFQTWLLGLFALVALTLAGVGIYGVMHHAAAQRRQEVAIRMALGAQPQAVLGLMIREALKLAGCGLAIGLAGAFWIARLMASLLFGVTPADPTTFLLVSVCLIAVATTASALPAWRASRIDPLLALRRD